jgi:hypothetical protein
MNHKCQEQTADDNAVIEGGRTNPIAECVLASAEIVLSDFALDVNIFLKLTENSSVLSSV